MHPSPQFPGPDSHQGDLLLSGLWKALEDSVIVATTGLDGRILEVNECFCRISGYSREELIGQDHRILNSRHHPSSFFGELWKSIRSGRTWRGDICNRAKDGHLYWVDTTIVPVPNHRGETAGFLSVRIDISERKRAEARLQEQFQLLQRVLESATFGVAVFDGASGMCVMANAAIARILGTSQVEMATHDFRRIESWKRSGQLEAAEATLSTGKPSEMDIHAVSGAGREFWVRCRMVRLPWNDRPHLLALAEDVRESRLVEAALRESEERLRLVMEAGRVGFWDWDLGGGDFYWSELVSEMLGEPSGIVPEAFSILVDRIHPEDRERHAAGIRDHLEKDLPYSLELRLRHRDGNYGTFVCRGQVLRDSNGQAVRMLGTLLDITALKRQEEALLQTQKLESLGLLAGGIAHDVNNLLATLQCHLDLALDLHADRRDPSESLVRAIETVSHTSELTRSLLAYAGKGNLVKVRLDLDAFIRGMTRMLSVSVPEKIHLELDLCPGLPDIEADPSQLQQVVLNLITNSVDAIGPVPGRILIRTTATDPQEPAGIRLIVTDTGCGMPPEHLSRIFDPFFTTKAEGRGLGLSAMQGILRRHGGDIQIQSRPGEGTSFILRFPAAEAGPA